MVIGNLLIGIQEQKCTRMFPFVYMMQKIKLHI